MPYKDKETKRLYDLARYNENLRLAREYKVARGCKDCGYNTHHAGLEFDHVRGKYKNVAAMLSGTAERLFAEIAKCEVVCGTCHNLRTWNRKQELDTPLSV